MGQRSVWNIIFYTYFCKNNFNVLQELLNNTLQSMQKSKISLSFIGLSFYNYEVFC